MALLACWILQFHSAVALKAQNLAVAAAVSVLETLVLGIPVMGIPAIEALA